MSLLYKIWLAFIYIFLIQPYFFLSTRAFRPLISIVSIDTFGCISMLRFGDFIFYYFSPLSLFICSLLLCLFWIELIYFYLRFSSFLSAKLEGLEVMCSAYSFMWSSSNFYRYIYLNKNLRLINICLLSQIKWGLQNTLTSITPVLTLVLLLSRNFFLHCYVYTIFKDILNSVTLEADTYRLWQRKNER